MAFVLLGMQVSVRLGLGFYISFDSISFRFEPACEGGSSLSVTHYRVLLVRHKCGS